MHDQPKKALQASDDQVLTIQAIKNLFIPASGLCQSPVKRTADPSKSHFI